MSFLLHVVCTQMISFRMLNSKLIMVNLLLQPLVFIFIFHPYMLSHYSFSKCNMNACGKRKTFHLLVVPSANITNAIQCKNVGYVIQLINHCMILTFIPLISNFQKLFFSRYLAKISTVCDLTGTYNLITLFVVFSA